MESHCFSYPPSEARKGFATPERLKGVYILSVLLAVVGCSRIAKNILIFVILDAFCKIEQIKLTEISPTAVQVKIPKRTYSARRQPEVQTKGTSKFKLLETI